MPGPEEEIQTGIYDYTPGDSAPSGLLSITPETYLGRPLGEYSKTNLRQYGLDPDSGALTRHSYLYSVDYPINTGGGRGEGSEVGKIELRARTWTYSTALTDTQKKVVKQTAHRAATVFDTTKQSSGYAGYLSGFNPIHPSSEWEEPTQSWEGEIVGDAGDMDAQAGRLDWNVEIYDKNGRLSGVAQGVAHPWTTETETKEKQPPQEEYRLVRQKSRGEYEIKPFVRGPGQASNQSKRAKNVLGGKNIYVNDKPVGTWRNARGTGAVKLDYTRPPEINGRKAYDRARLIEETAATPQSIADGGRLYKVEETEQALYFVTAARKPENFDPAGMDDVGPNEGTESITTHTLFLRSPSSNSAIECRRDETIIRHLGKSVPEWRQAISREWKA